MKRTWILAIGLRLLNVVSGNMISTTPGECLPTYITPNEVPAGVNGTGKKKIVWLDIMHNVRGLRNSYQNAQFHKCTGMARNCVLLPHVITEPRVDCGNKTIGPLNADAVLIMGVHLDRLPIPLRRDSSQVFVFVEREPWYGLNAYYSLMSP